MATRSQAAWFLEQAAKERREERAFQRKSNAAIRSSLGSASRPTNATIESAATALAGRRAEIVSVAAEHAESLYQKGIADARAQLGKYADQANGVNQDNLDRAVSLAREAANREVDLRIRQLEAAKDQGPLTTARTIRDIRQYAGNNLARAITYEPMNAGFMDAVAGLPIMVVWVTALDERVRHSHRRCHGQVRHIGQPFPNGLLYPHQPGAPIEEVINCRCRLKIVTVGALQTQDERFLDL